MVKPEVVSKGFVQYRNRCRDEAPAALADAFAAAARSD